MAPDGLNHQGAIAVVFDASSLGVLRNHGQTSGHSFENQLIVGQSGEFIGVDLGDNYPRGVHLHKFDQSGINSRVVYTFKTEHGKESVSPAGVSYPPYHEISGHGETFYKWSNDNCNYTEIGGLVEVDSGIMVVFAGERSGLDNSRSSGLAYDPRNIGLVIVRKDFENVPANWEHPSYVSDELITSMSPYCHEGGFYTFQGAWSKQRVKGVVWITNFDDGEHASRLKVAPLRDGHVLLLWEKWGKRYQGTYMAKIRQDGSLVAGPTEISSRFRLNRRDETHVKPNGDVVFVQGDSSAKTVEFNVLSTNNQA